MWRKQRHEGAVECKCGIDRNYALDYDAIDGGSPVLYNLDAKQRNVTTCGERKLG